MTTIKKSAYLLFTEVDSIQFSHQIFPDVSNARLIISKEKKYAKLGLHIFFNRRQIFIMLVRNLFSFKKTRYIENDAMKSLKIAASYPNACSIVSLGTPGPYNKQAVLLLDEHYNPVSITKVAANKQTSNLLKNEAYWLQLINNNPRIAAQIPSFVQNSIINSLFTLTQTVNNGGASKFFITEQHTKFITNLQDTEKPSFKFNGSVMHTKLLHRTHILKEKISKKWSKRAYEALNKIVISLKGTEIPMVIAHRDFAPWNIKNDKNGIFVFDWEYASKGYFPLYDIFHFIIMPLALKNKISIKDIHGIITKAENFGLSLDNGKSKIQQSKIQLLGYLLDVCLFYLESNDGDATEDSIVNRYALLIDEICK